MATNLTAEQLLARAALQTVFPPYSKVTTIVRHVSQSGMSRAIQVLGISNGEISDVTHLVTSAGLGKRHPRHPGLMVKGAGMDMAWKVTHDLAHALYNDGYALFNNTL